MIRATAGGLAVAALAAAAGCSPPSTPAPGPVHRPATAGLTATASAAGPRPLFLRPVASVRLVAGSVGPVALDGRRALFPAAGRARADWDQVVVWRFGGRPRTVARTRFPHGLVNWVVGTGDWVAWTDQSRRQSDTEPNVLWRVTALNLRTGTRRVLATNGTSPDPFVPQVRGADGYVFWTQPEPDRSARELVWSAARPAASPWTLLRHAEMTPGSETAAGGQLVYLGPAADGHGVHTVGGDCWSVPLNGSGTTVPLTRTALAMGCAVSDAGQLVWTEHVDPMRSPPPPDGILDDPYRIRTATLAGAGADSRVLHQGYLPMGYPVAGAGFAAWPDPRGRVVVRGLSSDARTVLPAGTDDLRVAADGDLIAYLRPRGTGHVLVVARVTAAGR